MFSTPVRSARYADTTNVHDGYRIAPLASTNSTTLRSIPNGGASDGIFKPIGENARSVSVKPRQIQKRLRMSRTIAPMSIPLPWPISLAIVSAFSERPSTPYFVTGLDSEAPFIGAFGAFEGGVAGAPSAEQTCLGTISPLQ